MILTVTLNPALDRIMFIPALVPGVANRIYRRENCIGGKGAHVSVNLADLGVASVATGIAMGPNGRVFMDALLAAGVTCDFYSPEGGDTRTNYIIVEDNGTCTQVCEKGPSLSPAILKAYLDFFSQRVKDAEYVVIAGDASNYTGPTGSSFQMELMNIGRSAGANVILDANGSSLREGVTCGPFMIKPNMQELHQLTDMPVETDQEVIAAIRSLDQWNIPIVAASMGGEGSIVRCFDTYYRVGVASIQYQNEVGCGDAFMAGMLCGLKGCLSNEAMLTFASACGGAMAENPLTVGIHAARARELQETVSIETLQV